MYHVPQWSCGIWTSMNKIFVSIVGLFLAISAKAEIPDWFISPPSDNHQQYYISAEGMTQEQAQKQAMTQLSQRLLSNIESQTNYQTSRVNSQEVSEFTTKVSIKGINAKLPYPDLINKLVDTEAMSFRGLFSFDKSKVQQAIQQQYSDVEQQLQTIVNNTQQAPFECSLAQKIHEQDLIQFKELSAVINNNWPEHSKANSTVLLKQLDNCLQDRELTLEISSGYSRISSYIDDMLAQWHVAEVDKSNTELKVSMTEDKFSRFGLKGLKLVGKIKLIENNKVILSKEIITRGYHPQTLTKARLNAQKLFTQQLDLHLKGKLRSN